MATFILLPAGTSGAVTWLNNSGGTAAATDVDNDNDDTQYITEDQNGHRMTFTMANPGIATEDISSITSVQLKFKARYTAGSGTTDLDTDFTGTGITHDTDNHTIASGVSYTTYSGDLETTSDGSSAWDYTDLQNLNVFIRKDGTVATARKELRISYLYAEVIYTPTVTGYEHDVISIGSGDIEGINGISSSDISKVNGI